MILLNKPQRRRAEGSPSSHRRRISLEAIVGSLGLLTVLSLAVFAPYLGPPPLKQNLVMRLRPPVWNEGGTWEHVLGTDQLGRDVLARLAYGARVSLVIGFGAATISALTGITLGLAAGYFRGWTDTVIMRLLDIQLSFPLSLFMILIVGVVGPSFWAIFWTLGALGWISYTRLIRAEALFISESNYVEGAVALGVRPARILARHILPNVIPLTIVLWTYAVPWVILAESYMSWLGLSVPPPTPTWGAMIADSREYLAVSWWMATLPGLAILIVVLSINLLGNWLRDRLDPRLRGIRA